jgi:N6-adenosine-specific RNA methylase IME4
MQLTTVQFSEVEQSKYQRLKQKCKSAWIDFANAIIEIRDTKLYRIEYDTFEDFCNSELGITDNYARRLVASAEVFDNLKSVPIGTVLPNTESQTRPLTKLEPELQPFVWANVVEENENITAKKVEETVDEYEALNEALRTEKRVEVNIFNPNPANPVISQKLQRLSQLPLNEQIKEVKQIAKEIKESENKEKIEQRRELIDQQIKDIEEGKLPELEGLFDVIAIDPPWPYKREYDPNGSRVANPYPEMELHEIKNIELPLSDNAVVFLWTTHQFLPAAFDILQEWGMQYKATIVWDKEMIGMGAWVRMQCEFCLVGIKGKPFWQNTSYRDILRESRREHSRKPDGFFKMVEQITHGRRLEYFSREARNGWEIFGNDTNKFNGKYNVAG